MHYSRPLPFSPTSHMVLHRAHISEDDPSVTASWEQIYKENGPKSRTITWEGSRRSLDTRKCVPPATPLPSQVKDREREGRRAEGPA